MSSVGREPWQRIERIEFCRESPGLIGRELAVLRKPVGALAGHGGGRNRDQVVDQRLTLSE